MRNFLHLPAIVAPLPNTLANGQTADAVPLMADLNWIVNQVNANAVPLASAALLSAANTFTGLQSGIAATNPANFPIASQVQNLAFNTLSSVAGSSNVITARVAALPLTSYVNGQIFEFSTPNPFVGSGAATLNIDAVGAVNLYRDAVGTNPSSGVIIRNRAYLIKYNTPPDMQGTGFSMINPSASLVTLLPAVTFGTPGDLNVVYTLRTAILTKSDRMTFIWFNIVTSTFTHTTAVGNLRVSFSAPGISVPTGDGQQLYGSVAWQGITKAGFTHVLPRIDDAGIVEFVASGSGQNETSIAVADVPSGGNVRLRGFICYPSN